ncbi:hypothetical protein ACIGO6_40165 [Streptomyces sp. NPDC053750]|uniref:hypothetical protein n=1 Tax=Streptomyces sp. NPDC053750 TaxID=3365714 RepID=UPI0037D35022
MRACGRDFTILRPGGFAANAFAWAETVRTKRSIFAPFGDVALPVIDPADIAVVPQPHCATTVTRAERTS